MKRSNKESFLLIKHSPFAAGDDYEEISSLITFQAEQVTKEVIIAITDDQYAEPVEHFTLRIEAVEGGVVFPIAEAVVHINDDDSQRYHTRAHIHTTTPTHTTHTSISYNHTHHTHTTHTVITMLAITLHSHQQNYLFPYRSEGTDHKGRSLTREQGDISLD